MRFIVFIVRFLSANGAQTTVLSLPDRVDDGVIQRNADDDANLRRSVKQLLSGSDVEIIEAKRGQEALAWMPPGHAFLQIETHFMVVRAQLNLQGCQAELIDAVEEIRRRVKEQAGVDLEPEVRIVGEEA